MIPTGIYRQISLVTVPAHAGVVQSQFGTAYLYYAIIRYISSDIERIRDMIPVQNPSEWCDILFCDTIQRYLSSQSSMASTRFEIPGKGVYGF